MRHLFFFILMLLSNLNQAQSKNDLVISRNNFKIESRLKAIQIDTLKSVYLRAFKMDRELEVWVSDGKIWKLFAVYPFCANSGIPGRKRIQGDRQIPEGCYKITEFNLWSNYHLSMRINYPNEADWFWADTSKPGGDIFIHGGCVTIGCIPITDKYIEELWTICKKTNEEIPVHIFSTRFDKQANLRKLYTFVYTKEDFLFQEEMKKVFFYFQKWRRIPDIKIDGKGKYVILEKD